MRKRSDRNFGFEDQFLRSQFRRQGWRSGFLSMGRKILREFFDKALRRPGTSFAESADGPSGDVIADRFQRRRILHHTSSPQHAIGNFLHPKRTLAARSALAARFVSIKLINVI